MLKPAFGADDGEGVRGWLVVGILAGGLARPLLFAEGGTVGAWASVLLFWACLVGLIVLLAADLLWRRRR